MCRGGYTTTTSREITPTRRNNLSHPGRGHYALSPVPLLLLLGHAFGHAHNKEPNAILSCFGHARNEGETEARSSTMYVLHDFSWCMQPMNQQQRPRDNRSVAAAASSPPPISRKEEALTKLAWVSSINNILGTSPAACPNDSQLKRGGSNYLDHIYMWSHTSTMV